MLRFVSEASGSLSFSKVDIILSNSVNKSTFTIGRALSSDLVIALRSLSREHCRFTLNNGGSWLIEDTSSTGTWVNGNKLSKNASSILQDNDIIKLGLSEDCLVYQFRSCVDATCATSNNSSPQRITDLGLCLNDKKPLGSHLSPRACRNIKENATPDGYVPESQLKVLAAEEAEKQKKLEQTFAYDLQAQKEKYEEELKTLNEKLEQVEQREAVLMRNQEEWNHEKELLSNDLEKCQTLLDKVKAEYAQQLTREKEEAVQKELQLITEKDLLFASKQEEWKREREVLKYDLEKRNGELDKLRTENARQIEEEKEKLDHEIANWEEKCASLKKLSEDLDNKLKAKTQELDLLTSKYNVQLLEKEVMQLDNNLLLEEKKRNSFERTALQEQLEISFAEQVKKIESEKEALCKERDDLVQQVNHLQSRLSEAQTAKEVNENQLQSFEELMENELQCAICTEIVVNSRTLVCGHTFCDICISEWLTKSPHCPNCRKRIKRTHPSKVLDGFIGKMVDNLSNPFKRKREQIVNEKVEVAACKQLRLSDFQVGLRVPEAYIDLTVTTHPQASSSLAHQFQ